MEGEPVDFQDWEVLQKSEDDAPVIDSANIAGIESDADGVFRPDYFSLDGQNRYAKNVAEGDLSEEGSVESDNPSWVDPALEATPYKRKNSSEFWSDSSSDRSEERKLREFDATSELGLAEIMKGHAGSKGSGETEAENKNFGELGSRNLDVKTESNYLEDPNYQASLRDSREIHVLDKSLEKCFSDSGCENLVSDLGNYNDVKIPETSESAGGLDGGMNSKELKREKDCLVESKSIQVTELKSDLNAGGDGAKRRIVWWKVPFEVLKYCVFRVNPVWSFSVAAAFMGFIILGRRLYKMKRKSQSLKLKVTVDDKVSIYVNNLVISITLIINVLSLYGP